MAGAALCCADVHGTVRFGAQLATVESATLELFNLFSKRPDWVLEVHLVGEVPCLWLAGTGEPEPYTRPRKVDVAYLDAPRTLCVEGRDGTLVLFDPAASSLVAVELGAGRARVDGRFAVRWLPRDGGDGRELAIEVDVVAAMIT